MEAASLENANVISTHAQRSWKKLNKAKNKEKAKKNKKQAWKEKSGRKKVKGKKCTGN
jgi:hypothetical protein